MRRMRRTRATRRGIGLVLMALAALSTWEPAWAEEGRTSDVVVTDSRGKVSVTGRFATVGMEIGARVTEKGWHTLRLLPSTVVLRSFSVAGKEGYIERRADHYVAHLRGKGDYTIRLDFVLDVQRRGAEGSVRLPLVAAAGGRINLELSEAEQAVTVEQGVPVEIAEPDGRTQAMIYPSGLDVVDIHWLPKADAKAPAGSIGIPLAGIFLLGSIGFSGLVWKWRTRRRMTKVGFLFACALVCLAVRTLGEGAYQEYLGIIAGTVAAVAALLLLYTLVTLGRESLHGRRARRIAEYDKRVAPDAKRAEKSVTKESKPDEGAGSKEQDKG